MSKPRPAQTARKVPIKPKAQKKKAGRKLPIPKKPMSAEMRKKSAPKSSPKRKKSKINWPELRKTYVNGQLAANAQPGDLPKWFSLKEIAAMFGCTVSPVEKRAAAENWSEARMAAEREYQIESDRKLTEKLSDQRVKSQVGFFQTAMKLKGKVDTRLASNDPDEAGIRALASATKQAQEIAETAFGKTQGPVVAINLSWLTFAAPPKEIYDALPALSVGEGGA